MSTHDIVEGQTCFCVCVWVCGRTCVHVCACEICRFIYI